jgi:hypothetical protein
MSKKNNYIITLIIILILNLPNEQGSAVFATIGTDTESQSIGL